MNSRKKIMKKFMTLCAMVALILSLGTTALASTFGVVKGGGLNLRQEPSLDAKVLGQYYTGTWVEILSEDDGWAKVNVDNKNGYMMSKFLNDGTGSAVKYVRTNTGIGLNLRKAPNMEGAIITSYPVDTAVKVITHGNTWSKVSVEGKEGYMATRFLNNTQTPSYTKPVDPFTAELVNINGGSIVNFRKEAGMNTQIIKTVSVGTKVTVVEMGENWSKVDINGQTGYVSTYFLKY